MSESAATPSLSQNWETLQFMTGTATLTHRRACEVLEELSPDDVPVLDEYVDAESLCNGLQAVAGRQFTEVRFSVETYEVRFVRAEQ